MCFSSAVVFTVVGVSGWLRSSETGPHVELNNNNPLPFSWAAWFIYELIWSAILVFGQALKRARTCVVLM